MKRQVIVIHGGETFDTYKEYLSFLRDVKIDPKKLMAKRRKDLLQERLGKKFRVISPRMPNSLNAKYAEWKIWFKKIKPFVKNNVVLVGHSLGGIFLAKYLSENRFPKKIRATLLVAAPFEVKKPGESLADFVLPKSLKGLENQGGMIFIYQSTDDKIVPFANCKKYQKALPMAHVKIFKNRGHFYEKDFPELIRNIKSLYRAKV